MHRGDIAIVANQLEVRNIVRRIDDSYRNEKNRHTCPNQSDQNFDIYPEVSNRSTDSPRPGHCRIVYGFAGDQRIGTGSRERDESVQLRKIVLAIGIDLERMTETSPAREIETLHHRG